MSLKIKNTFLVFFISMISCQNKNSIDSKAADLFKQASDIFKNNPLNNDSLMFAVHLLDSNIHLNNVQTKVYFLKYQISMRLKRYDLAIESTNGVLAADKNNFLALFGKGVAFDLLNNSDSAMNNYKKALGSLESTQFETSIFKEHERIILYGLLKDTVNFNLRLKQFKEAYSTNKEFPAFYEDLIQFNRSNYINSY